MAEVQNPTNPALQNAYNLAKSKGYTKDIESFTNLISTDDNALNNIYTEVKSKGYQKDIESFKTLIGLKKKDVSTSADQKLDSGQKMETGSLDSPEHGQLIKDIDSGKLDSTIKSLSAENKSFKEQRDSEIKDILTNYNEAIAPTQSDLDEIESAVLDVNEGETYLSQAYKYAVGAWRGVKPSKKRDEAKAKLKYELSKSQNVSIDSIDDQLVEDTYVTNKREELLKQKRDAKSEEFIEANPDVKERLKNHFSIKTGELTAKNSKDLLELETLNTDLETLSSELDVILSEHDETKKYDDAYINRNIELAKTYTEKVKNYNTALEHFNTSNEDLMDVSNELDLFKRNYSTLDNFVGKLGIAGEELVLNLGYLLNKAVKTNPNSMLLGQDIELSILAQKHKLDKERGGLRKGKRVADIDTWENATEWALDLVAEQTPNTILMATTGGASLPLMGATSAGGKLFDLEQEEREGKKDYSALEKYGAAFLTGTAEALSEKVSLGQINKAKRVFKTVGKEQLKEATTAYIKRELPEYFKDVLQEGSSEALSQFSENIVDKYLLGKDKNMTDGLTDAFVSGAFMSGLIYKAPSLAKGLSESFRSKDFNQKINDNFSQILVLDAELKSDLGPESKKIIEDKRDRLLETTNRLVDAEFKAIDNLDIETKNELLAIEQSKYKLRKEVEAIQDESNLDDKTKEGLVKGASNELELLNRQKDNLLNQESIEKENTTQETKEEKKSEVETVAPETDTSTTLSDQESKLNEGSADSPSPVVELNPNNTNETQTEGNIVTDGDVRPGVEPSLQQGEDGNTQPTVDNTTGKGKTKTYKLTSNENAPSYTADFNEGVLDIKDKKGNTPSPPTIRKVRDIYANDLDFTKGEKAIVPKDTNASPNEIIAKESNNPSEVAELLDSVNTAEYIENNIDYKKRVLADNVINIEKQSYIDNGDANNITNGMAKSYFSKKGEGRSLDTLAQELSEDSGIEITEQDIVEHMESYPNGKNDVYKEFKDDQITPLKDRFTQLTGLPANDKYIKKAVDQSIAKENLDKELQNNYLNKLTDEELVSLFEEIDAYEKAIEKNTATNTRNEIGNATKNSTIGKKTPGTEGKDSSKKQNKKLDLSKEPVLVEKSTGQKYVKVPNHGLFYAKADEDIYEDENGILRPNSTNKNKMAGISISPELLVEDNINAFKKALSESKKAQGKLPEKEVKTLSGLINDYSDSNEQASQSRVKSLTNERIKPSKTKPKDSPKKLSAIVSEVSKALKATLVYGKSARRGTAGTYNPSNSLVKIRNANDLDTVAHELGHLLDDRHDILGPVSEDTRIKKQLNWYSNRGGSNPPSSLSKSKKESYLQREGLAEFIRAYVVNPKSAKTISPELYNHFESTIDAKTKTVLKDFSNDVLDFENASYGEKINANIEDSSLKEKSGFKDWIRQFKDEDGRLNIHWLDNLKSKWTNSLHIANKAYKFGLDLQGKSTKKLNPEDNFEVISRLLAGVNGKINATFTNGLVNSKNKVIKDSKGLKFTVDYLLEALDTSSEKSLNKEMRDVIAYLVAQRTVEYAKKFNRSNDLTGISGGLGNDLEIAAGHLAEVKDLESTNKEQYDRIIEGARRYREFADAGLKYAVEKGRLSQEQYDRIKETNEFYVSLARTKEVTPGDELLPFLNDSNKLTSVKDVIKKAKGGTDTIKDPYLSLLHNTVNFIKESDRNEVMNSFVDPFRNKRVMGDGAPIDLSQVARKVPSNTDNTKKVFNDGELEYWQFDQDIYDSLTGLESVSHNEIIKTIGMPADLIRFTVTNFPVFAARNAVRDTMARLVISRTEGNLSDLNYTKEEREAFELYGGSQAGFYLQNKDAYVDEMNSAVKKLTKKGGIILDPRKLSYKGYRKALERGENLNRIAEFKSAYKKAKKEGMDDYNAGLYAAYQARDLMDFAVAGHYMRTINKLIPFSNATVQSVKRNIKGAKENFGQFAMRMALYTLAPQLAFRVLVVASGDEEEYEQLPDYQRDLFWNFKTPLTGDVWISIPKPFELGLPSSFVDRGISYARGNKEAFEGAGYSSYNTLNPFDVFSMTGPFKPIIEATSNYDSFRDRDIVPFWEKDKLIELREGTKYASRVGKGLSDAFGFVGAEIDPRKIDHVVKGYTTYFGNTVLSIGDIGKEDSRNQFDFTKTGFAKGVPISSAKSVKKALKLSKEIGSDSDKKVKYLKGLVKAYYDIEDKKIRKELSKVIYNYSENILIPYLEAKKTLKTIDI